MESKEVKYIEAGSRTVIRSEEIGKMGRCWSRRAGLQLWRSRKSRDPMCSTMTIFSAAPKNGNVLTK